jgi:protein-S-isoprenylcysteine O-methyltransferase Ste14
MILSALAVFFSVVVYGLVHSLLASLPIKAWVRRRLGPAADRYYRLVYNGIAALTFLPVLALAAALPGQTLYRLHLPWTLLALGMQLFAVCVLALGVLQTGAGSFLGLRPFLNPQETAAPRLVVTGLYRYVRHPLYSAGLLFLWLTPVMTTNLLAMAAGLTIYILVGTLHEEYRLMREFGEAYREYRRRTPMLIPFPWASTNK